MPPAALAHQSRERFARVARWAFAFESRFVAIRFKTLDPADEGCSPIEKSRFMEPADECVRKTCAARMIQHLPAIVPHAIDPGNREQPGLREIFQRLIQKHGGRNADELAKLPPSASRQSPTDQPGRCR